jgi:hypothetical protein
LVDDQYSGKWPAKAVAAVVASLPAGLADDLTRLGSGYLHSQWFGGPALSNKIGLEFGSDPGLLATLARHDGAKCPNDSDAASASSAYARFVIRSTRRYR